MSEFEELCEEVEKLDPLTFGAILEQKSANVLVALTEITADGMSGVRIFENFILMSVAADGKLTEKEYDLVRPTLEMLVGGKVDYETAKKAFNKLKLNTRENKDTVDMMVDVLGALSPELKNDIITICLLVCAVDGKITGKERAWIRQLIE